MFERYAERSRRALFFARYEATQLGSISIEPEHLLLGVIHGARAPVTRVFSQAGARPEALRNRLGRGTHESGGEPGHQDIPFAPATKRALQYAVEEADRFDQHEVRPEHLLLALLREHTSAFAVLSEFGITLDTARAIVADPALQDDDVEFPANPPVPASYDVRIFPNTDFHEPSLIESPNYWWARAMTRQQLVCVAWGIDAQRLDWPGDLASVETFDVILRPPRPEMPPTMYTLVQAALERRFGLTVRRAFRDGEPVVIVRRSG